MRGSSPTLLHLILAVGLAIAIAGCTKENAAFCCLDPADCAAAGVNEPERACADGLACVGNACVVPSCATAGCGVTAPVCDTRTDTCAACADATDCMRFPGTEVCDLGSGGCVACVMDLDCPTATAPICDANACRGCTLDTECASGACADDGSCVPEADVVYLHPQGTDAVPCSKAAPCRDLRFAVQQTSSSRSHLVFAAGAYVAAAVPLRITDQVTNSTRLHIHGGGASLTGGSGDDFISIEVPTTIRDLELVNPTVGEGRTLSVSEGADVRDVRLRGYIAFSASGQVSASELTIVAQRYGIENVGALTLNRASISGGVSGIRSYAGSLNATNVLIFNTQGPGVDVSNTVGTLAFSTISGTGQNLTVPAGVLCSGTVFNVRSSIIWTPLQPPTAAVDSLCKLDRWPCHRRGLDERRPALRESVDG